MTTLIPKFEQPFAGAVNLPINQKLQQTINVLDFGADPTGATDSTAAIQAALTAAGSEGIIYFPKGTFLLSATLNALGNQQLIGAGHNNTIFRRFTDYGNTLYFANAGGANVSGIWFWHGIVPSDGATTLPDKVTTGSHIYVANCQTIVIENCWFWRMVFQINIAQGAGVRIRNCNLQGYWNTQYTATQEGIACISLATSGYTQLIEINNNYFGGYPGGAQSVIFTPNDGAPVTVNFAGTQAGSQYGVLAYQCEGLLIKDNYFGGMTYNYVLISPNGIMSQIRIEGNFFDGGSYFTPVINFQPSVSGNFAYNVVISDNTFTGGLNSYQSIGSSNPFSGSGLPTLAAYVISNNSIVNNLGSGIFLRDTWGGVISDNQISSYNSRQIAHSSDVNYCSGIYVDSSVSVAINGNLLGGGINTAYPNGYSYLGIVANVGNTNVTQKINVANGNGTTGLIKGRIDRIITNISANYTMNGSEDLIIATVTAGIQITAPSNVPPGYTFTVKDGGGNFATYNSSVIGTVDGVVNKVMGTNYQSMTFAWNGTQWNVIGN